MTPEDAQAVAQTAAKAANMAADAHEKAFHTPDEVKATVVPIVQAELAKQAPPAPHKPLGFLRDPADDLSSKRLESFIALGVAVLYPFVAAAIKGLFNFDMTTIVNTGVLIGAAYGYSAAMQGVSYFAEKGMS